MDYHTYGTRFYRLEFLHALKNKKSYELDSVIGDGCNRRILSWCDRSKSNMDQYKSVCIFDLLSDCKHELSSKTWQHLLESYLSYFDDTLNRSFGQQITVGI